MDAGNDNVFTAQQVKRVVLENIGATQNIDTLGPIWTFSLRGVLTFVASGLDINSCVLSYFEGTANLLCHSVIHCYAVHSLLYIVEKCHFFSVVTLKDIIKYLQINCHTSVRYCIYIYIYK